MRTRDEKVLEKLYENIGDYPPGMTARDMRHVEGDIENVPEPITDSSSDEDIRLLNWKVVAVNDLNIDDEGGISVKVQAYDGATDTEYEADASISVPFNVASDSFSVIENIEVV